jgi:hypothetical protein
MRRRLLVFAAALLWGCAHGPAAVTAAPAPAPVVTPPAPAVVLDTGVRPGRFDAGKMWTFENPPLEYFRQAYGFTASDGWLTHARLAALRLPNCTASFVSGSGLVMSNHHCARESVSAVSRPGEDVLTNGFFAERLEDERRVPDLYLDQLVMVRDVTGEIMSAVRPDQPETDQLAIREQKVQEIERRASDSTRLRCDVTTLYYGGKYSLYCYRRYADVRLVFVPEKAIGYFGGDPDNFTYPRYDLDVSFFRVYDESGKPLRPEAYLAWSDSGAREGDAVFVVGNPGSTSRLRTVAQLDHRRSEQYPFVVQLLESRGRILADYMTRHPETRSRLINRYFEVQNSLKSFRGQLDGLRNPELMGRKIAFERKFRSAVMANPALAGQYGGLWDQIADLRNEIAKLTPTLNALNQGGSLRSQTLGTALALVRYAQAHATGTPDSALAKVRAEISRTTMDRNLDALLLAAQLEDAAALLGANDPWVAEALGGRAPRDAAQAIVTGSIVPDSAQRELLLATPGSVLTSNDVALKLIRDLLPRIQPVTQQYRTLQQQEQARTAELARALFAVYGSTIPPDATFTLRLADGVVKGYSYNGTRAPAFTTFYGLYDRHYANPKDEAWELPDRWRTPPSGLDLRTPLDMVMTNDIIGGNSGSPVIDRSGRLVGLIFDGNMESLSGDFIYTDETARAVAVDARAIREALRNVYRARRVVDELGAPAPAPK